MVMDYTIIFSIAGYALAVIILIYQEKLRRKSEAKFQNLEEKNRSDAWHLYQTSFNSWSKAEKLTKQLSSTISGLPANEISEHAGEVYILSVELTREIIKLIKSTEQTFNEEKLNQWRKEGKIPNDYQLEQFRVLMKS
jgi:hypothetical protein